MTIRSGFFNSVNGDRKYDARWFAEYFATFIGNGVFPNPSTNLQVVEGTNMQTIVKVGKGWINGYYVINDSDYIQQHDIADGVLKRIDRIVMRLNYLTREIEIAIKKGALSSNPVAPSLQRDADAYELALADVLINNGATQITQANITDTRLNNDLCGIVHGVVDQVDTTTLYNQYLSWFEQFTQEEATEFEQWRALEQTEFDNWFQSVKDILNTNVAMDLQNQITALSNDYVKNPGVGTTTNVGNDYSITLDPAPSEYKEWMGLVVTINADSTNSVTMNVNGLGAVPVKKANGGDVKILNTGGVYTLRYSNGNFILQGEGGGGTATEADLLSGKTAVSDAGDLIGTMPNRGAVTSTINAGNSYTIPEGYHNGSGKVTANSLASQTPADATAANIVSGKTAWVNGQKITGTIPIPVDGVNAISYNPSDGQLFITPPRGYFDGVKSIKIVDADYIPANILRGKNLFGIIGTAPPIVPLVAGEFYERFNYGDVDGNTYYGDYVRLQQNVWTAIYKPIYVQGEGSVRYSFKIRCGLVDGAYVQIFKNGIPFGTRRNVYYTAAKFVEDIDIEVGDVLELKASSIGTSTLCDVFLYGIRIMTASKPVIST